MKDTKQCILDKAKQRIEGKYVVTDDGQHWISTNENKRIWVDPYEYPSSTWLYLIANGMFQRPEGCTILRLCDVQYCVKPDHQELMSLPSWKKLAIPGDWRYLQFMLASKTEACASNGCRYWKGHFGRLGYPIFEHKQASHWVYFLRENVTLIPENHRIWTTCGDRKCVESTHLSLVAYEDAYEQRLSRGTADLGENSGRAHLNTELVREIKLSQGSGLSRKRRAELLNVSRSVVADIDRGKSWSHLGSTACDDDEQRRNKRRLVNKSSIVTDADFFEAARKFITSKRPVGEVQDPSDHWHTIYKLAKGCYPSTIFRGAHWRLNVLSWMAFNDQSVPKGKVVRHKCGPNTEFCINPSHLEIGSHRENAHDRYRDGTMHLGEKSYRATINDETARNIKESKGSGTQRERAARFSVSIHLVKSIDAKQSWKHI